ncbi:MAG: hypothetical protein JO227_12295 [Acetobacteraceae bacterium]|nr:hypothetical protein [Acetobacteraceae bacterium]
MGWRKSSAPAGINHQAAETRASGRGRHSDVVEQHGIILWDEYENALNHAVAFRNVHPAMIDQRGVVVEHGTRCATDARNVVGIRNPNDLLYGREVGLNSWTNPLCHIAPYHSCAATGVRERS